MPTPPPSSHSNHILASSLSSPIENETPFKDWDQPWESYPWTALDLETTGAYPLAHEICEIGLVQWQKNTIQKEYTRLIRPKKPISKAVQNIHGISNEMVAKAPKISDILDEVYSFIKGSIVIAHHAPFDLGFLSWELEKAGLPLPTPPVLCSSLLARKCLPESPNHRLQTLVKRFGIHHAEAHRALSDSKACLEVALQCLKSHTPPLKSLKDLFKLQPPLQWKDFSILELEKKEPSRSLLKAIQNKSSIYILYRKQENFRPILPLGWVRSPQGDWIRALCLNENVEKNFFVRRIAEVRLTPK